MSDGLYKIGESLAKRMHTAKNHIDYVQKTVGSGSGSAKGVSRDHVIEVVRQKLLDCGIDFWSSQVGPGRYIDTGEKSSNGKALTVYVAMYSTTFQNIDDPQDIRVIQHEAQGNDYGDKAPGKAATYAEKLNYVKGLALATGIEDEARLEGEGDGNDAPQGKQAASDGEAIRAPQSKSAAAAAAQPAAAGAEAVVPASKGLLKQLKLTAEAKGVDDKIEINFAKGEGYSWDALPKSVCVALQTWVNKQPDLEPGSNG